MLVLATLAAYANAWPDTLVWDDVYFAASERFSGLGPEDIHRFFTEDLWAGSGGEAGLYRPLLLLSIMLDTRLFGDWVAGYHLTNILLHVLTTLMVFGLLKYLLEKDGGPARQSSHIAVLAAAVFGVHPIHTEVVDLIFNRSEILVSLGVTGGLWWFLRMRESRPGKAWFGLNLAYLPLLLCRENAVALPALAAAILLITLPGSFPERLRKCIPVISLAIPLSIYVALRANALATLVDTGHLPPMEEQHASQTAEPPGKGPFLRRLVSLSASNFSRLVDASTEFTFSRLKRAIRFWADALKIVLWPSPLTIQHGKPETGFPAALALLLVLLGAGAWGLVYKHPGPITGLAFFYIAILPSSALIGAGRSPQLSERFLYLPSVGLAITLAFGLRWLVRRFGFQTVIMSIVITTVALTPLTWARNAEWGDKLRFAESEYSRSRESIEILPALVQYNLDAGNLARAVEICDQNAQNFREKWIIGNNCGSAYEQAGRYEDAERAYLISIENVKAASQPHFMLARMYVKLGRRAAAREQFELGIETAEQPFIREFYRGFMLIELFPHDRASLQEAKVHLERSQQLQPQYFPARDALEHLNEILARRQLRQGPS